MCYGVILCNVFVLCYGVILCNIFVPCYGVSLCNGVSLSNGVSLCNTVCYGFSPYYGASLCYVTVALITRSEHPKGTKDEVKVPEEPPARCCGPEGPWISSTHTLYMI